MVGNIAYKMINQFTSLCISNNKNNNFIAMLHDTEQTGIAPAYVKQLLEMGAVLADVRTHCEYAGYHIAGSINIPYDEIGRMIDFIEKLERPIITFSTHGRRSEIAAQKLMALGFEAYNGGTLQRIELAMDIEQGYGPFRYLK